jgi:hypothetical protein
VAKYSSEEEERKVIKKKEEFLKLGGLHPKFVIWNLETPNAEPGTFSTYGNISVTKGGSEETSEKFGKSLDCWN